MAPARPTSDPDFETLKRRLERETRARREAEDLLEEKSAALFEALERVKQERDQSQSLLAAVEAAHDGLAIADADGRFVYMNRAHETMFDYAPGTLIGRSWSVLYDPNELARFESEIMPRFTESGSWRGEAVGRTKDRRPVHQEIVLTGLEAGGLICATRDISDRKQREHDARALAERLRLLERDAALFTLSSSIAHDFNNLLFAIGGHLRLLSGAVGENPAATRLVARIEESLDSASGVVRSLRRFRRAELEQNEAFDLAGLVARTVEIASSLKPVDVRLEVSTGKQAVVTANELMVSRCLVNLLKNAFEASPPGGNVGLRLSARKSAPLHHMAQHRTLGRPRGDYCCVLEIEDAGCGVPKEHFEQIFEPFFTTKLDSDGTGLGLNALSLLVECSPVWVLVESLEGKGTRFSIFFGADEIAEAKEGGSGALPITTGTQRILLIDDDEPVGALVCEALRSLGHEVTFMTRARDAVSILAGQGQAFDILMTDLNMPEIRGDALARAAKVIRPGLICIGFSGQADFVAPDPVFSAFLSKPMDADDLDDAICSALRGGESGIWHGPNG